MNFPDRRAIGAGTLFAALYPLGMPGYDVPGLSFVALVPLIVLAVSADDARAAARRAFLAGTAAELALYYWIAWTVAVPGRLGWLLGSVAALLVSAYLAVYVSLAGLLIHHLHRRYGAAGLWAVPVVWTGLEYARSVLFTGFPWMLLGYSLAGRLWLRQAADLVGILGLGFLVVLVNVFLYRSWESARDGARGTAARFVLGAALLVAGLAVYGARAADRWEERGATPATLRVGIAQGGIDQNRKWDPAYQLDTLRIYRDLTRELRAAGARVIVWPETATPFFYGWETELSADVDAIARENGVPLIFGAPWFDPGGGGKFYNSVYFLDGNGIPRGRYDKRHLVPFGEYIPLRRLLFFLRKLTAGAEDFTAGEGPALFPVEGARVGASVCYEAVFPEILRDSVRAGAQLFVNVTNDSWFGDTVAPRQHLAMARMRSVEFRRPMVRAANAGISASIDVRGEIAGRIPFGEKGTLTAGVTPCDAITIHAKMGEVFGISCTILSFLILLISVRGTHGHGIHGR